MPSHLNSEAESAVLASLAVLVLASLSVGLVVGIGLADVLRGRLP
jgi:hypothetical protein